MSHNIKKEGMSLSEHRDGDKRKTFDKKTVGALYTYSVIFYFCGMIGFIDGSNDLLAQSFLIVSLGGFLFYIYLSDEKIQDDMDMFF